MLSLSPRKDMFRLLLPNDILPPEVKSKYAEMLNKMPGVITSPIDYLNESIVGIEIPGINSVHIEQSQVSFGRGIEPHHQNTYISTKNPLDLIDKDLKITFRMNQGLYNYFMLYETLFYRIMKTKNYRDSGLFELYILNEAGKVVSKVTFMECSMDSISSLAFEYTKVTRDLETFDVVFKFNNIDFDFIDDK